MSDVVRNLIAQKLQLGKTSLLRLPTTSPPTSASKQDLEEAGKVEPEWTTSTGFKSSNSKGQAVDEPKKPEKSDPKPVASPPEDPKKEGLSQASGTWWEKSYYSLQP